MKMKKILSCLLVAVMIIILMPQAITVFAHEYSDDRVNYLVVAKNEASYNVINREYKEEICEEKTVSDDSIVLSLTATEAESIEEYSGTAYIEKDILFKEFSEDISPEDLIEDFLGGETECAEEDYPANIYMVNGDNVNLASEENIVVGVLDSGIANHSDLNVTKRVCLIPDMYVDNNLFSYDLSGHGTGVAGVIGAKNDDKGIIGIYENVELYSIQVLTPSGEAPLSRIVAGIDWAIENDVDVLNMSFGTSVNSEILYDAIVRAANSGMVLVAAAGNTEYATQYPAKYSEVISVGSVDGSGNISDFSAKDDYVDIYAPGESIISTTIVGGYTAANGTSLAAPHVTAAAALIKAVNGQRTTAEIRNLILATANTSIESNPIGILDIENMLLYADEFDYASTQTTYQNSTSFDEYNQDDIAVGYWADDKHQQITQDVIESKPFAENDNLRLMIASSYLADSLYGIKVEAKVGNEYEEKYMYNFYPLHAYDYDELDENSLKNYPQLATAKVKDRNSNYVADVKYLYRLARCFINNNISSVNEPTVDEILGNISTLNNKTRDANITELNAIVRSSDVLYTAKSKTRMKVTIEQENNQSTEVFSEDSTVVDTPVKGIIYMDVLKDMEESTPIARACKIMGLALHLVGDAYAHRVQIPPSSTNDGDIFAEDLENFYAVHAFYMSHQEDKTYNDEDMELLLRYKYNKENICNCFYCFRQAVMSGNVEFRDIKLFQEEPIYYYKADHTNFYQERYEVATYHATDILISKFFENRDFSITTFAPTDTNYTLKLNNLKQYIISSGVKWNDLTADYSDLQARIEMLSTSDEI